MCTKIDWERAPSTDASDHLHVVKQLSLCSEVLTARGYASVQVWMNQTVRSHRPRHESTDGANQVTERL